MDLIIYEIFKVQTNFALEVWVSIYYLKLLTEGISRESFISWSGMDMWVFHACNRPSHYVRNCPLNKESCHDYKLFVHLNFTCFQMRCTCTLHDVLHFSLRPW